MYDIIIIGAGIAGLTAAIYAARAGKTVLIIEEKLVGGQIIQSHDIRNWPGELKISGEELIGKIKKQAEQFGAKITYDTVEKIEKDTTPSTNPQKLSFIVQASDETYHAKSLIIATGSHDRPLDCLDSEKYLGHGLSYCVTCDGALYKDKTVAVVGGGNTAFYDVLYLANLARKVYLIHRRQEFRADTALVEKVKKLSNVEFKLGYTVVPEGQDKVERLLLYRWSETEFLTQIPTTLKTSALFVAIGRDPNTEIFQKLVKTDQNGYIIADENCQTSQSGVFVAGDCRTKSLRQLITAASDGANAATAAVNFLH